MYSIMAARYKYFPEVKTKGMAAVPRLIIFTSEHVSFPKSIRYKENILQHVMTCVGQSKFKALKLEKIL